LLSLLGLLGGLVLVAVAITLGSRPAAVAADPAALAIARAPAGLVSDGFALGRRDAPVTIDLYEDFQCPACKRWSTDVFPSLAANELSAGTVRIVFHDMAFLGAESTGAGLAAYAAAQQGRFWDMWATVYANQGRENSGALGSDRLRAMAQTLGLDMARFDADRASDAARASIAASQSAAVAAGVTSTPTLVLDGQLLVGVQPYAQLTALIGAAAAQ
jgi:protein-disulfide isomerase